MFNAREIRAARAVLVNYTVNSAGWNAYFAKYDYVFAQARRSKSGAKTIGLVDHNDARPAPDSPSVDWSRRRGRSVPVRGESPGPHGRPGPSVQPGMGTVQRMFWPLPSTPSDQVAGGVAPGNQLLP